MPYADLISSKEHAASKSKILVNGAAGEGCLLGQRDQPCAGARALEQVVTVNTAASGGDVSLLAGEE